MKKQPKDKNGSDGPDENSNQEKQLTRRDVIFSIIGAGALMKAMDFAKSGLDIRKGVFELDDIKDTRRQRNAHRYWLEHDLFFGDSSGNIDFVPGQLHTDWSSHNKRGFDDDVSALVSIQSRFEISSDYETIPVHDAYSKRSHLVLAGAQLSNAVSHDVLQRPRQGAIHHLAYSGLEIQLAYNFEGGFNRTEQMKRTLSGIQLTEWNNSIVSADGKDYRSLLTDDGSPRTGYLLFSKLPHPKWPDQYVYIWCGNTGPSTEGTALVFDTEAISDKDLENAQDRVAGHKYYQMLFEVADITLDSRVTRHRPKLVRLQPEMVRPVNVEPII